VSATAAVECSDQVIKMLLVSRKCWSLNCTSLESNIINVCATIAVLLGPAPLCVTFSVHVRLNAHCINHCAGEDITLLCAGKDVHRIASPAPSAVFLCKLVMLWQRVHPFVLLHGIGNANGFCQAGQALLAWQHSLPRHPPSLLHQIIIPADICLFIGHVGLASPQQRHLALQKSASCLKVQHWL